MSTTAPTYEEFIAEYTALAEVAEAKIESKLSLYSRLLSLAAWGSFYSDAVALCVAHDLALDALAGTNSKGAIQLAMGPVSSVSAAGVSTSFATPTLEAGRYTDQWYQKTGYGQQFLMLREQVIPMGAMAV